MAQQEKAEASRRVIHRTLVGAAASLVLAVAASGAGFYTYLQRGDALAQRQEALAQKREAGVLKPASGG